jgi:hypothetical protein
MRNVDCPERSAFVKAGKSPRASPPAESSSIEYLWRKQEYAAPRAVEVLTPSERHNSAKLSKTQSGNFSVNVSIDNGTPLLPVKSRIDLRIARKLIA